MASLPPANSSDLILAHPTEEEKKLIWSLSAKNWGSALSLEDYLEREEHLANQPQTKNGGLTHWILTTSLPPNARPILSSCETLRRPALLALPPSQAQTATSAQPSIKHGITHGIGSVFCAPEYRKKGYTSTMLRLLGPRLANHQQEIGHCPFSILYSDIGPKYYAGLGWKLFRSSHVSLPAISVPHTNGVNGHTQTATPLEEEDFPPLLAADEERLKSEVQTTAKTTGKPAVALIPDARTIQWHHLRQTFMTSKLFPSRPAPAINGAISSGAVGSRVWILFTRSYYGKLDDPSAGNKLYVLRLVVEDDGGAADENAEKLKAVLKIAQQEAGEWALKSVVIWNVSEVVRDLLKRGGGEWEEVDREEDSLASLMWYGEGKGDVEGIEWVANEKFGWC